MAWLPPSCRVLWFRLFSKTYELAIKLIKKGLAYVCELSQTEISEYRGTLTKQEKFTIS